MTPREGALEIVARLRDDGARALLAGGCVRDILLGFEPQDYDVATDADPDKVVGIFPDARMVGAHFGVTVVPWKGNTYEVARFRQDVKYTDGRRPDQVVFVGEEEDAHRRDFTVNGMFWDPVEDRILDYVGGRKDLDRRVIRCIGDPDARFTEDRLRMLRAIRFASRFGWNIDPSTNEAIARQHGAIGEISAERIRDEIALILTEGGAPIGIRWLIDTGLMSEILPEVIDLSGVAQPKEFHPEGDVLTHTLLMLGMMGATSFELAMGVLLHDIGKPKTFERLDRIRFNNHDRVGEEMTDAICRRLRVSVAQSSHICALVRDHHRFMHVDQMKSITLKRFLRIDRFADHLELHRLDCLASHGNLDNYRLCQAALDSIEPKEMRPDPLITGDDLIRFGYRPGPAFKEVLSAVEDAQLEGVVQDHGAAIVLARKRFRQLGVHPEELES